MRIIGVDGWTLRDELKYYDVGVTAFGNFMGVTDRAVAYWLSGEKENLYRDWETDRKSVV